MENSSTVNSDNPITTTKGRDNGRIKNYTPDVIDGWFDKTCPKKNRRWLNYLFCGIGALIRYSMAPLDAEGVYSIGGAIIGIYY